MQENNEKTTKLTGFQVNPQNINKAGRPPKEFSMTYAFKEVLSEKNPETKIEKYKELINKALTMALRGDGDMIKYIINRLEGMPQGSATNVNIQNNIINIPNNELTDEQFDSLLNKTQEAIRERMGKEVKLIMEEE